MFGRVVRIKHPLHKLAGLAVVVHIMFLLAALDIYFTSTIEHGLPAYKAEDDEPPSRRVVLIVADGLRASALYHANMETDTPFLYNIKNTKGSWGISHARVPTESRPGHVAILGGIFEDPSAIFKGWQANPVEFDTVLNQSKRAICFGSPDIVNLFNKGNSPHIESYSYTGDLIDFSGRIITTDLDYWVFKNFKEYVERTKPLFIDDGFIIFLHLLGIDTAGHVFKPHSREYKFNVRTVDGEIEDLVGYLDNYFDDGKTTYIFTSDHGMTNWGSHGDASPDESEVPIIAWGAGIVADSNRNDIRQVDIAPLISALLGINFPRNSMGIVPLDYLFVPERQAADIIIANTRQITENFLVKERRVRNMMVFPSFFTEFREFSEDILNLWMSEVDWYMGEHNYQRVIQFSQEVIKKATKGLDYYNNYFQVHLSVLSTIAFTGWMTYLITWLPRFSNIYRHGGFGDWQFPPTEKRLPKIFFIANFTILVFAIHFSFLLAYILYFLFPFTIWYLVFRRFHCLETLYLWLTQFDGKKLFGYFIIFGVGIQLLIQTFNYRQCLIVVLVSYYYYLRKFTPVNKVLLKVWGYLASALCVFLLLPVNNTGFNSSACTLAFTIWMIFSAYLVILKGYGLAGYNYDIFMNSILPYQVILLGLSFVNLYAVKHTISRGQGLLILNQEVSWILLLICALAPIFAPEGILYRLISINLSLVTVYMLMVGGYEGVFISIFCLFNFLWVLVEQQASLKYHNIWSSSFADRLSERFHEAHQDLRKAFIFYSFIMLAFFGTENLSSLNAFDPTWVQCFIGTYHPFPMALLIMLKLLIPFLISTCSFQAIVKITNMDIRHAYTLVLLLCDIMVLQFFYNIRNEGSWAEIGMSLSQFVIALLATLFLVGFYFISKFLTTTSAFRLFSFVRRTNEQR